MQEQVFINCMPEDLPLVKGIDQRLELAGFSFYVSPISLHPVTQKEVVEKIKSIAAAQGCMLCVLSKSAISNSWFISNIQLMCEAAHTERVLINYEVESLENDQTIRLFASQAYQVKGSGNLATDVSKIIQCIHQCIHPHKRNIFQFLFQHISRKVIIRLFGAALVLGVGGAILFNVLKSAPAALVLPTPTPVVMFVPFSGQSQDAGLDVSTLIVPEFKPDTDPALEAPFSFHPAVILEHQDFNDPAFDHTYNAQKWRINFDDLDDASTLSVTQTNGVLQLAVAPLGYQQFTLGVDSKYLYNLEQVTYLGYRFRVDDYQGIKQENTRFFGTFTGHPNYISNTPTIKFNGMSQNLYGDNSNISLGSRWHTIEMVSQGDKHLIDVYLDGKKIDTLSINDEQLNLWIHYSFSLDVSNTTDWVRIQIDEVIFGADHLFTQTLLPEDAPYRFTPDTVDLHVDFETQTSLQYLVSGMAYVSQADGQLSFRVPAGKVDQGIRFEIPSKPITEDNYYATRFRFTSPDDNYWANGSNYVLGFDNKDFKYTEHYILQIGTMRQEYSFMGMWGLNGQISIAEYNQNAQPGNWHTLEMLIKPPIGTSGVYTVFYWVDGYLLGKGSLENPMPFLDATAPLMVALNISSGSYRANVFSGDIDDLIIGSLSTDKIQE